MGIVLDRLYQLLVVAMSVMLAALTAVVSYQVMGRYVPVVPRALWTEEISRLCLEWLVFLGAAVAVRRGEHFVIDLLPQRAARRLRRPLQVFVLACLGVMSAVILWGGIAFAQSGVDQISTTSGIRLVWAHAAIPVAGGCMVLFVLEQLVAVLRGRDGGADGGMPGVATERAR